MSALLMWDNWFAFFGKMANALFPVVIVLIVFTFCRLKSFKVNSTLRFMLTAIIFTLLLRGVVFFSGVLFAKRYFYTFVILILIMTPVGLKPFTDLLHFILLKFSKKVKYKYTKILIIGIISVACIGKAIKPDFKKTWITQIGHDIREMTTKGDRSILINDLDDKRVAYYARSKYYKFSLPGDIISNIKNSDKNLYGIIAEMGKNKDYAKYMALDIPKGISALAENIRTFGKEKTFVLLRMEDSQLRKLFQDANVEFELKLIKTYKDHKKKTLNLYKLK